MATIKWQPNTIASALTTGLDSLANGSRAISSAIDNDSRLDLYCDLELTVQWDAVAPTAGTKVADVYLLPSVDGTNFAAGSATVTPQASLLVASFETRNPSTTATDILVATGIPLPPGDFKLLLINTSGQTFETANNTLKIRTYRLESS